MNLFNVFETDKGEGIQKDIIILQTSDEYWPYVLLMREGSCADNGSLMPSEDVSFYDPRNFFCTQIHC